MPVEFFDYFDMSIDHTSDLIPFRFCSGIYAWSDKHCQKGTVLVTR